MIAIITTPVTFALIDFAAILRILQFCNIEKMMQFENNCVSATLSSVAAMYNLYNYNQWVIYAL